MGKLIFGVNGSVRQIPWAPLYFVSDCGKVFSTFRMVVRRKGIMRHSGGYPQVNLATPTGPRIVTIHSLVAELFLPPRPTGAYLIRHWDDDPTNNAATNLFWGTQVENKQDARRNGRRQGRKPVIGDDAVRAIRRERNNGVPGVVLAERYGISQQMVSNIYRGSKRKDVV